MLKSNSCVSGCVMVNCHNDINKVPWSVRISWVGVKKLCLCHAFCWDGPQWHSFTVSRGYRPICSNWTSRSGNRCKDALWMAGWLTNLTHLDTHQGCTPPWMPGQWSQAIFNVLSYPMWRWLREHLQVNQGELIGTAESSWPISSPWIKKAAAELPREDTWRDIWEEHKETHEETYGKNTRRRIRENEKNWANHFPMAF